MDYWKLNPHNIFVAAHRGWSDKYPENTVEAFAAARDLGVDQIETDVRITKDGELVCIHDATVDRTTNGTGKVCDFTLDELRKLDAGSHKSPEYTGAYIPTFKEFLDLFRDHPTMTLDIELKEYPVEGWEEVSYSVCDRVLQMVDAYGYTDRVVINTFSGKLHEYIQRTYGNKYRQHVYFPIANHGEVTMDPYSYGYCCCMFGEEPGMRIASKSYCDEMASKGVQPWAGAGVKDEDGVNEAIAKGCYLITCNNPDVILRILKEKGYHQ